MKHPQPGLPYKPEAITKVDVAAFCALWGDGDGPSPPNSFGLLLLIDGEWQAFTVPLPDDPALTDKVRALLEATP